MSALENLLNEWSKRLTLAIELDGFTVQVGAPRPMRLSLTGRVKRQSLLGRRLKIQNEKMSIHADGLKVTIEVVAADVGEQSEVVGQAAFFDGRYEPDLKNEEPSLAVDVVFSIAALEQVEPLLRHYPKSVFVLELDGLGEIEGDSFWDSKAEPKVAVRHAYIRSERVLSSDVRQSSEAD